MHKSLMLPNCRCVKNNLVIKIKRLPQKLKVNNLVVLLDAGHGGENTGAKGVSGILEKDYTLMITKEIEKYFKTSEFNEISQKEYKVRANNKEIDSKIESIVSAVSVTKNKIKFTP